MSDDEPTSDLFLEGDSHIVSNSQHRSGIHLTPRRGKGRHPPLISALCGILMLSWLLASTTACSNSTVKPLNLDLQQRQARADALLNRSAAGGPSPGTATLIAINGEVVYRQSKGLADIGLQEPITAQTNFRLASISKQMTAMTIMLLAEEGRLDYADSMVQYLPQLDVYGPEITLRHLLIHTAGLPDVYGLLPSAIDGRRPGNRDLIPALVEVGKPLFPAGQRFDYCNVCYDILAMVVEEVSGRPFSTFLEERVFRPLGMNRSTTFLCPSPNIADRALGYRPKGSGFAEFDSDPLNCILGAGGIYSSVEDLHRWTRALDDATLVSATTLAEAFTSGTLDDGEPVDYGFGWTLDVYRGQSRASHTGSWVGFRNYIARYPDAGLTILMLSNRSDFERQRLADRLADLFLDLAMGTPDEP